MDTKFQDMILWLSLATPSPSYLINHIHKKMAAAPIKLRTTFNLQCYTYEGVEAIRASLLATKAKTIDDQF